MPVTAQAMAPNITGKLHIQGQLGPQGIKLNREKRISYIPKEEETMGDAAAANCEEDCLSNLGQSMLQQWLINLLYSAYFWSRLMFDWHIQDMRREGGNWGDENGVSWLLSSVLTVNKSLR